MLKVTTTFRKLLKSHITKNLHNINVGMQNIRLCRLFSTGVKLDLLL